MPRKAKKQGMHNIPNEPHFVIGFPNKYSDSIANVDKQEIYNFVSDGVQCLFGKLAESTDFPKEIYKLYHGKKNRLNTVDWGYKGIMFKIRISFNRCPFTKEILGSIDLIGNPEPMLL